MIAKRSTIQPKSVSAVVLGMFALIAVVYGMRTNLFSHASAACTTTVSSVASAQSAVSAAKDGDTVCVSAGTYGTITLTGNHTGNVTFEPDPSLDPNGAGKVTFNGINVDGNFITVRNFYSTGAISVGSASPYPAYHNDVIDHNNIGPTNGYGISIFSAVTTPSSFITISNNIIHDTNKKDEGDALRIDGWNNVTITGNEIYNIAECPALNCHTDTLQSYQAQTATSNLTITKNYIHDTTDAQGFPFLKDGDISNVTIADNLSVRMQSAGEVTGIWVDENINGLNVTNNTYQGTSGSNFQTDGSNASPTLNLTHNVFDSLNEKTGSSGKAWAFTENNNIFSPASNMYTFTPGTSDLVKGRNGYTGPTFKCGSTCGNGTLAGDDYELATNPNGIGIDWSPANQSYGPVNNASGGSGDTTAPTTAITSPASGASIQGVVAVTASASDNVAVANVQLELDGKPLGSALTASPYTASLDTTKINNGAHTLSSVATDTSGNTGTSTTINVTVANPDTQAPSTPTNVTAVAPTAAQVKLTWTASTDNVGVTSYRITRTGGSGSPVTMTDTNPTPTPVSFTDSNVSASTAYSYTIVALDAAGNTSSASAPAAVTTPALPDTTPPSTPTGLTSPSSTTTSISLVWNSSTDNTGGSGLAGYHLYRGTSATSLSELPSTVAPSGTSTVTYSDSSNLTPGATYYYAVSAFDNAANGSVASAVISASTQGASRDVTPPSVPRDMHSVPNAKTQTIITFAWSPSHDNKGGSGLAGYRVYRVSGSSATLLKTTTATRYTDSGLSAGTQYSYFVRAVDVAGNPSATSRVVTIRTRYPWWHIWP